MDIGQIMTIGFLSCVAIIIVAFGIFHFREMKKLNEILKVQEDILREQESRQSK